ncbi:MAG TPA: alpha/beta hydrolase family protein, partial [Chloroflexota bacterium]|nr:alpha/beta hydrolase family protein [Chloroflexota bacterium]
MLAILLLSMFTVRGPAVPAYGEPATGPASIGPNLLHTLTLYSPALHAFTRVNVLLPAGYARSRQRYPVLYLLHGFSNSYASWAQDTDLIRFAHSYSIIIVMPDGGNGWYINDANGGPRWEDYHIHQLIPFIDRHYRTIASRAGRAIAGLSMGGFGALSYAARHPDLFIAAASFSGALDVEHLPPLGFGIAAAFGLQDIWPRVENSPADLAPNLRALQLLYMATGTGKTGPLDQARGGQETGFVEATLYPGFLRTVAALKAAGVTPITRVLSPGTHSWPYWQIDLHRALPLIEAVFLHPRPAPATWTYKTGGITANVWGYRFTMTRRPGTEGFFTFGGVSPHGFTVTGAGRAAVVTGPVYRARQVYRLRWDGRALATIKATRHGQLRFILPLTTAGVTDVLAIQMAAPTPTSKVSGNALGSALDDRGSLPI